METKLERISELAENDSELKFTSLAHLLNEENLKKCYRELGKNKAPGVDGETWDEYGKALDENIKNLVERLKVKSYWPKPVKRTYIPKEGKDEERPIGIPALEDKIVQLGISKILTAIYEADFLEISYGFRPERSPHDALRELNKSIMVRETNWILDADIKGFFDHVDHEWMIRCLKERIKDTTLLKLIGRFLKAGIVEEGKYSETNVGTPQGGNLSPVLSNIYLHYVLDLWVKYVLRRKLKGYVKLIRFADDFVICFQARKEAKQSFKLLKERLAKFGLELHEGKTRLIEFGRHADNPGTFDFLGITHSCSQNVKGGFMVGHSTSAKKFRSKIKELRQWLKLVSRKYKPTDWWDKLRSKLLGHFRYYGVSGNYHRIREYKRVAKEILFKWLNRRSQKRSYSWDEFDIYLKRHPLPKPKVYHDLFKAPANSECDWRAG